MMKIDEQGWELARCERSAEEARRMIDANPDFRKMRERLIEGRARQA